MHSGRWCPSSPSRSWLPSSCRLPLPPGLLTARVCLHCPHPQPALYRGLIFSRASSRLCSGASGQAPEMHSTGPPKKLTLSPVLYLGVRGAPPTSSSTLCTHGHGLNAGQPEDSQEPAGVALWQSPGPWAGFPAVKEKGEQRRLPPASVSLVSTVGFPLPSDPERHPPGQGSCLVWATTKWAEGEAAITWRLYREPCWPCHHCHHRESVIPLLCTQEPPTPPRDEEEEAEAGALSWQSGAESGGGMWPRSPQVPGRPTQDPAN